MLCSAPLRGTETLKGRKEGKERYTSTIELGVVRLGLIINRSFKKATRLLKWSVAILLIRATWTLDEPFSFYLGALGVEKNNDSNIQFLGMVVTSIATEHRDRNYSLT